ncbi:MAG: hypothetical protein JSV65_02790 [Armatimonadota bacterium]|nr:MAG: hypothetical protein JSV65_02790 [Armatimonadota bacterium]
MTYSGPPAPRFPVRVPPFHIDSIIGNALIALAVGALAGAAVKRWKWLVGPGVIAVVAPAMCVLWLAHTYWAAPLSSGDTALFHYRFHIGALAVVQIAVVLAGGGLGGALSPRIFRRVPLSLVTIGALAWCATSVTGMALAQTVLFAYRAFPDTEGRLLAMAGRVASVLPLFLAAAWMALAARRGVWIAASVVGAAAAFQILTGYVQLITFDAWGDAVEDVHWVLRGFAAAAAGAWAALALSRRETPANLTRDGMIIIAIICVMAIVAGYAETLQLGIPVPTLTP